MSNDLKLNPDPTFDADIKVTIPGKQEPGILSMTFRYRGKKAMAELWKKYEKSERKTKVLTDVDLLMDIATGWKLPDAEFTRENVELFLDAYPASANEISMEYTKLSMASRVKN